MKALIFDTETTGLALHKAVPLSRQPRIIEWGGVLVNGAELIEELDLLINPGIEITAEITRITGISNEMVTEAPTFAQAAERFRPLFSRADVIIAHNLPFDRNMLLFDLERAGIAEEWPWPPKALCTVQEHLPIFGHRPKLVELYQHYTGTPLAQTHRALDDVKALWAICLKAGIV